MNRLQNKVAIITGGNSGVGAATAKLFAQEGANVVITARRADKLKEVAQAIEANGGNVLTVTTDISKLEDCERLVDVVNESFGPVDILVNNAGVLEEGLKPIDKFEDEDLARLLQTNTIGTMDLMRAVLRNENGERPISIVNVDSIAGLLGCGGAAYVASKAAVLGITKHTALRYAGTNIRCNAVCPGTIVTPMVAGMRPDNMNMDMFSQMAKHADLKVRPCQPEDVANLVLFLASDESKALTGNVLTSDFGSSL
ncbi:SDR family NAD(P)-dependent oxidoreductase [uncultured Dubosiella sp.]|uniref:SDR family NAD(P)-dependent oxidoreductase n=1 Tax=uncultured Dubosiella sp. TaxID=1937011 RepID=UPI0025990623|nr:SDR family oxidoreductase [uncultured Dubosiella sp.]